MDRADLAAQFLEADDPGRERLWQNHRAGIDADLGYQLKDICLEAWASEPARATRAAAALQFLARRNDDGEISACALWSAGIAALVSAQMESAIAHLDDAAARFKTLGLPQTAAATQVSKLIALAIVGRYDDAISCGVNALSVLEAHGDILSSGKIEHNIGNIYWRRDQYDEAERFFRSARVRFEFLRDDRQLATLDNCLAYIQALRHNFRSAEELYGQALKRAEDAGLVATQAGIESSIGNLALFQGRYDRALDFLERARRKYADMGMAHESAVSELEIADAYLELNLGPEAAELYERVTPIFEDLSMRAEQTTSLAHHGRAAILMGQMNKAHQLLEKARVLNAAEGNTLGEAMVVLTIAQMHHALGNHPATILNAEEAEGPLTAAGVWRHSLLARWLCGDAARALGSEGEARTLLESTLADSEKHRQPQVALRCHTSLGLVAAAAGDTELAEASFMYAIELIEALRAPLPAEEFRAAFFSDKLVPYAEIVRLCLSSTEKDRAAEALIFVERARSRALVDMMGGVLKKLHEPRDAFELELAAQLEKLREELNWLYSKINRSQQHVTDSEASIKMAELHRNVAQRENKVLEVTRRLYHRGEQPGLETQSSTLDIAAIQRDLGKETSLVEYTSLDGRFLAFVVTDEGVKVIRDLGLESEVDMQLEQLRFQIDTLRFGAERMRKHLGHLTERALVHLQRLFDLLIRPIRSAIGDRRLAIVPHRSLHYVPFQALHDRDAYLIEQHEVVYAPSASALHQCLRRPARPLKRALLVGVPDEQTPRVRDEVIALAPLFAEAITLVDEAATLNAVKQHASNVDVVHLACHGQFRPDNPRFSSLRLSREWITVRDVHELDLHQCELVSLSACETGLNTVAPGDELIGLTRGFFSAGAPALLLSLWTVDDATTADLMLEFYTKLCAGASAASALRHAQLQVMKEHPHPFFWSPFALFGRW